MSTWRGLLKQAVISVMENMTAKRERELEGQGFCGRCMHRIDQHDERGCCKHCFCLRRNSQRPATPVQDETEKTS